MQCCVYWVRTNTATDITLEGYVGITVYFDRRMEQHKKCVSGSYMLYNAIRKYGWDSLDKSIVAIGSIQYCLDIERKLRPTKRIGWNIAVGGGKPPIFFGSENPSSRPEVVAKRKANVEGIAKQKENTPKGKNHPRITNPEKWAHVICPMHRPEVVAKVSAKLKGKPKPESVKGENHPRRKNPELWGNANGNNHWTRKNPENVFKNGNPMKNPEIAQKFRGANNKLAKKVICIETGIIYGSMTEASRSVKGSVGNIWACCKGKLKTAYGYHWEYVM